MSVRYLCKLMAGLAAGIGLAALASLLRDDGLLVGLCWGRRWSWDGALDRTQWSGCLRTRPVAPVWQDGSAGSSSSGLTG